MSELRERMSNAMCLRGMAARTQEAYIGALVRVLRDQRRDFVAASVDRQVVGKLRFWQARPARRDRRARFAEQLVALRLQRIALAAQNVPQVARHRPQTALIECQAVGEGVSRQGWHSRLRRRGAD